MDRGHTGSFSHSGDIRNSCQLCISGPHIKLEIGNEMNLIKYRGPESEGPFVPVKEVE